MHQRNTYHACYQVSRSVLLSSFANFIRGSRIVYYISTLIVERNIQGLSFSSDTFSKTGFTYDGVLGFGSEERRVEGKDTIQCR